MTAEQGQPSGIAAPPLAPHTRVFVVVHKDPLRERIDVRPSRVLHLEGDVLFLAQTDPPLAALAPGAGVEVAVLLPDDDGGLRPVGYMARLLDVRRDYPLDDGHSQATALALSAPAPQDYFETSLRMHHRVPVEPEMGVFLRLADPEIGHAAIGPDGSVSPMTGFESALIENVELMDFSAGGARARVPARSNPDTRFDVGRSLPFRLIFVGSGFAEGLAVVRSQNQETTPDGQDMLCLGLCFTNMEIRDIRYMERMVARTVSTCRQREKDASYT